METRRRRRCRLNPINNTEISSTKHLPEEIVEDILARVPVKSLLRFKCVSKAWRRLISSERFSKIHLEKSEKNTSLAHHGVIFIGRSSKVVKQCPLQPLLNDPSLRPSSIFDPDTNRRKAGCVVAQCNGLVCIIVKYYLFLWNPATGISRKIQTGRTSDAIANLGLGWDETSGAYKLVDVRSNIRGRYRIADVYSSKTDSWNRISHNDRGYLFGRAEVLGGKFHWLGGSHASVADYIVTLDMKSEAFGKMELPCEGGRGVLFWTLVVSRGFLSFLTHNAAKGLSLWVMKDYGVKESWENVMTIPSEFSPPKFIFPLYMGLNGEILLFCESNFFVYNKDEDVSSLAMEIKRLRSQWSLYSCYSKRPAFVYIQTLVSPFTSSPES